MSSEIAIKLATTGQTVNTILLDRERSSQWDGEAMTTIAEIEDVNWPACLIECIETVTADGTGTKRYVASLPDGLLPGEYIAEFYLDSPTPSSDLVGVQAIDTRPIYDSAMLHGLVSGAGTPTEKFFDADGIERVRINPDRYGNRTAVEL